MPANADALLKIQDPVFRILTQQIDMASPHIIAKSDWHIFMAGSGVTRLMAGPKDITVYVTVSTLSFFHFVDFKMRRWSCTSGAPPIPNCQIIGNALLHHTEHSTYAIDHEMGQSGKCKIACQSTSSHIRHYS